jgi:hypothetical protein
MDAGTAKSDILENLTKSNANYSEVQPGFFQIPRPKMLAALVQGDKVGAAEELCEYLRTYCNSEEFSTAYNLKRENSRPTSEPPQVDAETIRMTKESNKAMDEQIADMKKNGYDKAVIESLDNQLMEQKKMVAEWEDPTPNKTKWEKDFPSDPAILVKKSLEEYLALVATVDFDAQLKAPDASKLKKFANPEYEKKSPQWKAVYRAGREVNDAVSAYTRNWLNGEIISARKSKMPVSTSTTVASSNGATNQTEASPVPQNDNEDKVVQPKKGLMGKLKDKAKAIIKD